MILISPIDQLGEAELLLDAGAEELYGGWVPEDWLERYRLLASINQRTFAGAQIAGYEDLQEIVRRVHGRGKRFSLTLNAPFYSDEQLPLLLDYVDQAVAAGVDGVILADLGLLLLLRRRHGGLEYHASTLAHLANSGAAAFYAAQGIDRLVFPRHLPTAEMAEIVGKVPGLRCDAFILIGNCPNSEGLCTFHHSSPAKIWPCEIPYRIEPLAPAPSPRLQRAMARQEEWARSDRRHGCGLCAIPALAAAGIHGLKLVGRGAPSAQKVRNLALVAEFCERAADCDDGADYRRRAREAHRQRFTAPCSPLVCYYPEYCNEA
jgi:putative protease